MTGWRALGLALALLAAPAWCASDYNGGKDIDPALREFLRRTVNAASSFHDRYDAEVWLLAMSGPLERFLPDHAERLDLLRAIHREATRAGLQPDLVLALIEVESHFDRFAVSHSGAQGLMQVMPFWRGEIGRHEDNLTDNLTNLRYGCRILQYYLQVESGNTERALARYNGTLGQRWYPDRVMEAWQRRWRAGAI